MLQDPQGRQFRYLRLSITDICNYRCNYCLPDGYQCDGRQSFLRLDEIRRLVAAFARQGIEKIRLTGGEPVLRRDLTDIISIIKATPGINKVAMTTNGHKLKENLADWANAGLDAINISCDSLDPRMFNAITGRDKLTELLQGIDIASNRLGKVKVNTVLMRQHNLKQFPQFLDWIRQQPITLRFIELMQTGDNQAFFDKNHVAASELQNQLLAQGWHQILRSKTAGPAKEYCHPDYQGQIGFIAPYSKDFCASCNRLRVSATGKLHLCLFGDNGNDIRPFLQNDNDPDLDQHIQQLLGNKPATHKLHQGYSGSTRHLAMLGG